MPLRPFHRRDGIGLVHLVARHINADAAFSVIRTAPSNPRADVTSHGLLWRNDDEQAPKAGYTNAVSQETRRCNAARSAEWSSRGDLQRQPPVKARGLDCRFSRCATRHRNWRRI